MLKCWNLFDSISHSLLTFPFLELWKDIGKQKLKQMIASVGVALDDSKQGFKYLHPDLKKGLLKEFSKASSKMNLPRITCDSFVFQLDHKNSLDSFDLVNAMCAVLSCGKSLKDAALKLDSDNDPKTNSSDVNIEQNFWSVFQQVLDQSVHQQHAIHRKGNHFRY